MGTVGRHAGVEGLRRRDAEAHTPAVASPHRTPRLRSLRALVALVALLAVALPSALGGAVYVWCEGMQRAMVRPCCPESHGDAAHPSLDQPCCDERVVSALPVTALTQGLDGLVAPPLVVFFAMAVWLFAMRRRAPQTPPPRGRTQARAGPEPPRFLLHCALRN